MGFAADDHRQKRVYDVSETLPESGWIREQGLIIPLALMVFTPIFLSIVDVERLLINSAWLRPTLPFNFVPALPTSAFALKAPSHLRSQASGS